MYLDSISTIFYNLIYKTNEILAGRYATPILVMITNMGMGFLLQDLAPVMGVIFSNAWMKRLVIFTIVFSAIREVSATLLFCLFFIFIFEFLLNDKSKFCIIPTKYRNKNKQPQQNMMENIKLQSASSQIKKEIGKLFDAYQNLVSEHQQTQPQKTPVSQIKQKDYRFQNYIG